jgi:hypothetical protein
MTAPCSVPFVVGLGSEGCKLNDTVAAAPGTAILVLILSVESICPESGAER